MALKGLRKQKKISFKHFRGLFTCIMFSIFRTTTTLMCVSYLMSSFFSPRTNECRMKVPTAMGVASEVWMMQFCHYFSISPLDDESGLVGLLSCCGICQYGVLLHVSS